MAETIKTVYKIEASSVYIGTEDREKKVIPIDVSFSPRGYYREDAEKVLMAFINTCSELSMVRGTGYYGIIRPSDHTYICANDERDWIMVFALVPIV